MEVSIPYSSGLNPLEKRETSLEEDCFNPLFLRSKLKKLPLLEPLSKPVSIPYSSGLNHQRNFPKRRKPMVSIPYSSGLNFAVVTARSAIFARFNPLFLRSKPRAGRSPCAPPARFNPLFLRSKRSCTAKLKACCLSFNPLFLRSKRFISAEIQITTSKFQSLIPQV